MGAQHSLLPRICDPLGSYSHIKTYSSLVLLGRWGWVVSVKDHQAVLACDISLDPTVPFPRAQSCSEVWGNGLMQEGRIHQRLMDTDSGQWWSSLRAGLPVTLSVLPGGCFTLLLCGESLCFTSALKSGQKDTVTPPPNPYQRQTRSLKTDVTATLGCL